MSRDGYCAMVCQHGLRKCPCCCLERLLPVKCRSMYVAFIVHLHSRFCLPMANNKPTCPRVVSDRCVLGQGFSAQGKMVQLPRFRATLLTFLPEYFWLSKHLSASGICQLRLTELPTGQKIFLIYKGNDRWSCPFILNPTEPKLIGQSFDHTSHARRAGCALWRIWLRYKHEPSIWI